PTCLRCRWARLATRCRSGGTSWPLSLNAHRASGERYPKRIRCPFRAARPWPAVLSAGRSLHLARTRHVCHHRLDVAEPAQLAERLLHARRVVRAEDNARAAAREALDGRPSHPGRAAGDDRHLSTEVE